MSDLYRIVNEQSVEIVELFLPEMLDSQEFDQLNQGLLAALEKRTAPKWVLDLSGVPYCGSAMLGLMVNLRQRIKGGGGSLVLCGMSPVLIDIFRTCSLERIFVITRDRAAAIREIGWQPRFRSATAPRQTLE
jgi:anti-anti-sigma factor